MGCCGSDDTANEGEDVAMKELDDTDAADKRYGKPSEYDPNFKGPIQNRGCTDIICCVLFILFILGLVVVGFFAYYYGNPKLLLYATNSENELCGVGKHEGKPFLYFYNLLSCLKGGPAVFVRGCPTTQVCVEKCPDTFRVLYRPNANSECLADFCTDSGINCAERIRSKTCPPFILGTRPLLNRCVPMTDKILSTVTDFYDESGKRHNQTEGKDEFLSAESVIRKFLRLKQFTDKIINDVATTWWMIAIAYVISCTVSFIWIVLMRWIAKPIVYLTIIIFLALFGFGVVWSFMRYIDTKDTDLNFFISLVVIHFEFSRSSFWLGLGITALILFLVVLVVLIFLRKRIQIAVNLIAESSRAVGSMMTTLLWPIVPFILQLVVLTLWITIAVYLASVGRGKNIENMSGNVTNIDDNIFQELDCKGNDTLSKVCGFFKYGTDEYTFYLQLYNLFMFFWLINFVVAVEQMTLAGAFASYYWAMEKPRDVPAAPLLTSFGRCFRYHLGTLAFGSLLIAIVKIIRVILEYFYEKSKKAESNIAKFFFKYQLPRLCHV